jgi:hypothetical protein
MGKYLLDVREKHCSDVMEKRLLDFMEVQSLDVIRKKQLRFVRNQIPYYNYHGEAAVRYDGSTEYPTLVFVRYHEMAAVRNCGKPAVT